MRGRWRVPQHSDTPHAGKRLRQQFERLRTQLRLQVRNAGHISARMPETGDVPGADGVTVRTEDDRNGARRLARCGEELGTARRDDLDPELNKVDSQGREPLILVTPPAVLDDEV